MLKKVLLTAAAAALFTPTAGAQQGGHDDHTGHAHAQNQTAAPAYSGPLSAGEEIEYVYTEAPDDYVIGADDAPVTVMAYASVTCPHCSKWFIEQWPAFKAEQIDTGNARFVMRPFPTPPQDLAMIGFIIADCAPEEEYFDHLVAQMQNQEEIFAEVEAGRGKAAYDAIAAKAGMPNEDAINACFNDPSSGEKINRSIDRAHAGNISSVPSFIIDGMPYNEEASAVILGNLIAGKLSSGVSAFPKLPIEPAE